MRVLLVSCLVTVVPLLSAAPVAAQTTAAPQAAPPIPPGEAPPSAAREPRGTDEAAAPGKPNLDKPAPSSDPPREQTR